MILNKWINQPAELLARMQQPPAVIGLDTEFIREHTWWPQLALVQIAWNDEIWLIDPLCDGMPQALAPLLQNQAVLKVMHSPSEDYIALQHACGVLPAPVFDTQLAAALTGFGGLLGYQKLVQAITGEVLEKDQTRSDWLQRPLSAKQLHYAADDVRHLGEIHAQLKQQLQQLGRLHWLEEDCQTQLQQAAAPSERWGHLSMRIAQWLDTDGQRRLLRLLRWRDAQALAKNLPRSWVLDNELIGILAKKPPASQKHLQAMLDARPKAPRKYASAIWQALQTALDDEALMPVLQNDVQSNKKLKAMQAEVASVAAALNIPEGVLCARKRLELALANGNLQQALGQWRYQCLHARLSQYL